MRRRSNRCSQAHCAKSAVVGGASSDGHRLDAALPQPAAVLVEAMTPVRLPASESVAGTPPRAPERRDRIHQRRRPGDVVPVAAGERNGEHILVLVADIRELPLRGDVRYPRPPLSPAGVRRGARVVRERGRGAGCGRQRPGLPAGTPTGVRSRRVAVHALPAADLGGSRRPWGGAAPFVRCGPGRSDCCRTVGAPAVSPPRCLGWDMPAGHGTLYPVDGGEPPSARSVTTTRGKRCPYEERPWGCWPQPQPSRV